MVNDDASDLSYIESRMGNGKPFCLMDLYIFPQAGFNADRIADRAIQRWRKRGWISFERQKGVPVWSLTETGRAALDAAKEGK